jgi:hypothetical protein
MATTHISSQRVLETHSITISMPVVLGGLLTRLLGEL